MVARFHYDDVVYQQLLTDQLPADEQGEITEHVEACEDCQSKLESLSQAGVSWEDVRRYLNPDDVLTSNTGSTVGFDRSRTQASLEPVGFLSTSESDDAIGQFGRYEIKEILGRGGMGVVMRGYDPALNRHSAIKVLAPELATHSAARKRFSREAKSAAAVVHEHVVPIQTVDEEQGLPYFVMPVVEGRSLEERVTQRGPLDVKEILRIGRQIALGLNAAHAQGLVHRDVKPANILLENGVERVMITDFGLARAADDASMTRSGVIAGTPQYMSPEQSRGADIDARSDLFSLGSVLYFMCTGHSPFRAETTMGVLHRIVNDEPRSVRSINPDVPAWLEAIINRLLSKDADGRYQSAEEVAGILERWLAHLQQPDKVAPPEKLPVKRASPSWSVRTWLACAAGFALIAIAAAVIVLETSKGTLTIESDADVAIRVMRGEKVVKRLTVRQGEGKTRIHAGEYVVEIDGQNDSLSIENGRVSLSRGGEVVVSITKSDPPTGSVADAAPRAPDDIGTPDFEKWLSFIFDGPDGLKFAIVDRKGKLLTNGPCPAPFKLVSGMKRRLHLSNLPGWPDDSLSPEFIVTRLTDEVYQRLRSNQIRIEFTKDDIDQVMAGHAWTKVTYLSHEPHGGNGPLIRTLVSTKLDPKVDVVAEAERLGDVIAVLRMRPSPKAKLPQWVSSKNVSTRLEGIEKLIHAEAPHLQSLVELLTDGDPSVRKAALDGLRKLKNSKSIYGMGDDLPLAQARKEQLRWRDIVNEQSGKEYQQVAVGFEKPVGPKFQWPDYPHQRTLYDYEMGVSYMKVRTGRFYRFTIPKVPGHEQLAVHPELEVRELNDEIMKHLNGKLKLTLNQELFDYMVENEKTVIAYCVAGVGGRWVPKIIFHASSTEDMTKRSDQNLQVVAVLRVNRSSSSQPTKRLSAGQTLLDAVREFNEHAREITPDHKQPPLTDEEVIASIRWSLGQPNTTRTNEQQQGLQMIVDQRVLPKGWGLAGGETNFSGFTGEEDIELHGWTIEVLDDRSARHIAHTVRQRFIRAESSRPSGDVDRKRLAESVRRFNARMKALGQTGHPPLTTDEVVAAILHWTSRRDEAPVSDEDFSKFLLVALPEDCDFELQTHLKPNDRELYHIHSIRLRLNKSDGSGSFAFTLREQFISVTQLKESDIHWGPSAKNGLQVGVRVSPASGVYGFRQPMMLEFVFRHADGRKLQGAFPNVFTYDEIEVFDSAGKPIRTVHHSGKMIIGGASVIGGRTTASWDGGSLVIRPASDTDDYEREKSRKIGDYHSPSTAIIYAEPGQSCRMRFIVHDPGNDSTEKLKTGEVVFKVANAQPKPGPADAPDVHETYESNQVTPAIMSIESPKIELPRMTCKLRIVDDETGERVEEYNVAAGGKKDDGTWGWSESTIHVNKHERLDDHDQLTFSRAASQASSNLRITANGYIPQRVSETKVADWSTSVIEVRLRRGTSINGRVVYLGEPVSGARVFMLRNSHRTKHTSLAVRRSSTGRSEHIPFVTYADTNEDGAFTLSGWDDEVEWLAVLALGRTLMFANVDPASLEEHEPFSIELPQPATLKVLGPTANKDQYVSVRYNTGGGIKCANLELQSDMHEDGRCEFTGLAIGKYTISLMKRSGARHVRIGLREVILKAGKTKEIEFPKPAGRSLKGRLAGMKTRGLVTATLTFMRKDNHSEDKSNRRIEADESVGFDKDGDFETRPLREGWYTWSLVAYKPDNPRRPLRIGNYFLDGEVYIPDDERPQDLNIEIGPPSN